MQGTEQIRRIIITDIQCITAEKKSAYPRRNAVLHFSRLLSHADLSDISVTKPSTSTEPPLRWHSVSPSPTTVSSYLPARMMIRSSRKQIILLHRDSLSCILSNIVMTVSAVPGHSSCGRSDIENSLPSSRRSPFLLFSVFIMYLSSARQI